MDPEVNATDEIAFDVEVTNTGVATAFAVTVNDTLPTDAGLSWSIDAANSDAGWTIDAGVLKFGPAHARGGRVDEGPDREPHDPGHLPGRPQPGLPDLPWWERR